MSEDEDRARVTLSRQTLAAYEANGVPGGRREDVLRMLAEEILILRGIEARLKPKTSTIADLIVRWEDMRARVRGH
jgi:hypothetical protein